MKRHVLLTLCVLMSSVSSSSFRTINIDDDVVNIPKISHRMSSDLVDDSHDNGYYYQSEPSEDEPQAQENFIPIVEENDDSIEFMMAEPVDPFEGDTFVSNKSFLTTYYSHLNNNKPKNRLGICGYTAISMFLSFYDTYWNDDFIPEQYDSEPTKIRSDQLYSSNKSLYESPGVFNNITSSSPSMETLKEELRKSGYVEGTTEYKEALDKKVMAEVYGQIDDGTFLGKLFEIAIDNGSIQPHFDESEYHVADRGYVDGIGVNYDIMNSVLSDYIEWNDELTDKVTLVTSKLADETEGEKERLRSEIVEIVKSGRPVLLGGNGYDDTDGDGVFDDGIDSTYGHVVVAYDYDEENDILYGNMGWSSSSDRYRNLDEYFNKQISDYWALNISSSLPKCRTDNYIFTDIDSYYAPGMDSYYNIIRPEDYGFPESYGEADTPIEKQIALSDTGETFDSERLRCGYIEETCINLSTKRYSPGLAYLEYTFDRNIYQIEVDLSWWSATEKVHSYDLNYRIEYKLSSGIYFEVFNLWDDIDLSTDRDSPSKITVRFPDGVRTFRFYGLASNPINDRNKGRLSIFDLIVSYYS